MKIIEPNKYYGMYINEKSGRKYWYIKGWTWRTQASAVKYAEKHYPERDSVIFEIDIEKAPVIHRNKK